MANEIIITESYTLSNSQLNKEFETIRKALNSAIKSANIIGKSLKVIKDRELWKDDFKSFEESAEVFGIKKAQAYNLIKGYEIYDKFKLEDFSNTQCVEIAKLDKAEGEKGVKSALESGLIKQSMTTKELREAIDNYLHPEKALEEAKEAEEAEAEAEAEAEEAENEILLMDARIVDGKLVIQDYMLKMKKQDRDTIRKVIERYIHETA